MSKLELKLSAVSDHADGTNHPVRHGLGGWIDRLGRRHGDLNELGRSYYEKSLQYDEAQLQRDSVKVRRKLDFIVLPMMMFTYMLSFLDKQTLNYSNAYGLQQDTHMTGDEYSWVSSALYFGWLVGAYPWQFLIQRYPIGRLIGIMLFIWGAVCMLQAAVFNFSGFFAIRFFLGLLEAVISPAFVVLTSMLWTREEQSLRSSYWLSVNGVAALWVLFWLWCWSRRGPCIPQWKLIYLIVGSITMAWGFVILFYLPDGPHNAKMLSEYERVVAVWRIARNQTGLKQSKVVPGQIIEAALDVKIYLLFLMAICYGILNGGVANFLSAIIKGFGYSPLKTSLLQTPVGAFELVMVIAFGYMSRIPNMIGVTIIVACLPGLAGLIGILEIPSNTGSLSSACAGFRTFSVRPVVLNWTLPGSTLRHTKRSAVLGVYFVLYCAGNIAGPHLFLPDEAPRYKTAIKGLVGPMVLPLVCRSSYHLCFIENRRKARQGLLSENVTAEEALESFEDLTDKQNKHFRYSL